jgi:hypothetical protein
LHWFKSAQGIFPSSTGHEVAPKLCEFGRNPIHLSEAFKDSAINFRSEKTAHQPVHGAPMIVRDEVGFSGEEHFLKLFDISAHAEQDLPSSIKQF